MTCEQAIVGPRGIGLVFAELGAMKKAIAGRLQSCWRYAVKAAKVPHCRFHDLWHTYGTRLRRDGKTYSDIADHGNHGGYGSRLRARKHRADSAGSN